MTPTRQGPGRKTGAFGFVTVRRVAGGAFYLGAACGETYRHAALHSRTPGSSRNGGGDQVRPLRQDQSSLNLEGRAIGNDLLDDLSKCALAFLLHLGANRIAEYLFRNCGFRIFDDPVDRDWLNGHVVESCVGKKGRECFRRSEREWSKGLFGHRATDVTATLAAPAASPPFFFPA